MGLSFLRLLLHERGPQVSKDVLPDFVHFETDSLANFIIVLVILLALLTLVILVCLGLLLFFRGWVLEPVVEVDPDPERQAVVLVVL